jgi:hypothetical protein
MPSSVILAMRYEPRQRELLIVFRGARGAYRYFDVPVEEWKAFRSAESKGTYLNRVFKRKKHPFERLKEKNRGILPVETGAAPETAGDVEVWGLSGEDVIE